MQYSDLKTIREMLLHKEEVATLTSGVSMRPMLREHRDVVVIKRLDAPLKIGDVVVYRDSNNQYVLHRILRMKGSTLYIRGDNNLLVEKVSKNRIIGVLKEFYRDGKYYSCEKSVSYKLYSLYIRITYLLRFIWKKIMKPFLSKFKRVLLGRK